MASFTISPASSERDLQDIKKLFEAYAESLGLDLTFQDFATELDNLPGKYSSPTGALLLARSKETGEAIGCCSTALAFASGRATGVGKALAVRIVKEAKDLDFGAIRLDTLPSMEAARALYKSLGFREIEAYYETPLQGTIFLELRLKG